VGKKHVEGILWSVGQEMAFHFIAVYQQKLGRWFQAED
jgi:hypothetical protein